MSGQGCVVARADQESCRCAVELWHAFTMGARECQEAGTYGGLRV